MYFNAQQVPKVSDERCHERGRPNNVGLGYESFFRNTTGADNVGLGYDASYGNASATSTVAIGREAAFGSGSGAAYNAKGYTTLGYRTGYNFQTGADWNTLLGYAAGNLITTGADNIVIGGASTTANSNLTTGSQNIIIGQNVSAPSATASGQLNIQNIIFGTGNTAVGTNVSTGNVGIGTTTPYSRLTVWGTDTASTSPFAVVNSASTTVFSVYDNGNATYSGSIFQSSDQRLKTNIQPLDASSSLAFIDALNPVSYIRLDQPTQGTNLGFVAQEVQRTFPQLVSTTSATALTPGGTLTLNYIGFIAPIVRAIQALSAEIRSLENAIASFAEKLVTKELIATNVTADTATLNKLCLSDANGTSCYTRSQLDTLLASQGAATNNQSGALLSQSSSQNFANRSPAAQPPVIQINGDNPAIIHVGDTYNDLGAIITAPDADKNLGLKTYLNGALVSTIVLDTSQVATDTVQYVATDQNGLAATSTRTVLIEALSISAPPPADATSTTATSTSQ